MKRRTFLGSSVGAGLWLASGACARTDAREASAEEAPDGTARPQLAIDRWGLQLYTVRSLMSQDVERTLAGVAATGYAEVEFAGYFGRTPAEILATLDAEGLTAPAVHLGTDVFRNELESAIEAALLIGHRYLVLPNLDRADRGDLDAYRRMADEMNGFGERCREAGLSFAYHNHDFELEVMDGGVPLEVLIEGTDPDLVSFEMDLFWMVNGGADPLDYFARYPGRFTLCHVKDRTPAGDMVDVGAGAIDFVEILSRSSQAGLRHYFVEHDNPGDPMASIEASFTHLSSISL